MPRTGRCAAAKTKTGNALPEKSSNDLPVVAPVLREDPDMDDFSGLQSKHLPYSHTLG